MASTTSSSAQVTNGQGPPLVPKMSLAEEKELYLECLGHLMGLQFKPRTGLQLVMEEGGQEDTQGEIPDTGQGPRQKVKKEDDVTQAPSPSSGSSQRRNIDNSKSTTKDDNVVTVNNLSLEQAKTWKTGAATATLAKFGISMQPNKQTELKKWEAFVIHTTKEKVNVQPKLKYASKNNAVGRTNEKGVQTERGDPYPFVTPRPIGLSKPTTKLHTIFNVPKKRPPPGPASGDELENTDRSSNSADAHHSDKIDSEVKRPKLCKSSNAKQGKGSNKKENEELPSFQTALEALVAEDKKKGIKRDLDRLPIKGGGEGGSNSSSNNPELEALLAHEKMKVFEPKIVEAVLSEVMEKQVATGWNDIAGLAGPKAVIKEIIIWPMLRPDIFKGLRSSPKGILLFGPPGTGKTMIGRLIATQSSSTFFNISASSLTSKWIGDGEKMVRCLFQVAQIKQPSVIFIDEIDSILTQRSETEHESSRRLKTEFLIQFDGCGTKEEDRVLVIGVTNRPQELDEAARRRLVKRIYIPLPDIEGRQQIVQNLMRGQNCELSESDINKIAEITGGYSGADMKSLCQEASYGPIRDIGHMLENISAENVRAIQLNDFFFAVKRVKSSVALKDLNIYEEWDRSFGCHIEQ